MAFGGGLDEDREFVGDINMVPLIDVMLVLLIVFMVTLPALTDSVALDLPRAQAARDSASADAVTLSVTADGRVYWNGEALTQDQLDARLRAIAVREPQPEVRVRGDRKAEYERVLKVMAAAQRAGVLRLGFVTETE